MAKTFNLYCDESTHLPNDKCPYMLLGCVSIAYPQIRDVKHDIREIMERHNFKGELKWINVHTKTLNMYMEIVNYFFRTDLKFRTIVVEKSDIDESRPEYSLNEFYFRMYYLLLHHQMDMENFYNIYLDIKDTCSQDKLHKLEEMLKYNSSVRKCQFVRSHESIYIQLADVLMGAINYNLRVENGNLEGTSIPKKKIVAKIKSHQDISLGQTAVLGDRKFKSFFISLR